ncbi:hypothetical protein AVEN_94643-1, partial [Araneus ventricosus]
RCSTVPVYVLLCRNEANRQLLLMESATLGERERLIANNSGDVKRKEAGFKGAQRQLVPASEKMCAPETNVLDLQ